MSPLLSNAVEDAARYLIYPEALLAAPFCLRAVTSPDRVRRIQWPVAVAVTVLISVALAIAGGFLYHVKPAHGDPKTGFLRLPHSSFPSHHALAATLTVAAVFFADRRWSLLFVALTVIIDSALITARHHQVIDVAGSTLFVAIGVAGALLAGPGISRRLMRGRPAAR